MPETVTVTDDIRTVTWLIPRMAKAVPYLGYIVVAAAKPGVTGLDRQ